MYYVGVKGLAFPEPLSAIGVIAKNELYLLIESQNVNK